MANGDFVGFHGFYLDKLILHLEDFSIRADNISFVCKDLMAFRTKTRKLKGGIEHTRIRGAQVCDIVIFYTDGSVTLIELKSASRSRKLNRPSGHRQLNNTEKLLKFILGNRPMTKLLIFYDKQTGGYRYKQGGKVIEVKDRQMLKGSASYRSALHGSYLDKTISRMEEFGENISTLRLIFKDIIAYKPVTSENMESSLKELKGSQMCDLLLFHKGGNATLIELKGDSNDERMEQTEERLLDCEKIIKELWGKREITKKAVFFEQGKYNHLVISQPILNSKMAGQGWLEKA